MSNFIKICGYHKWKDCTKRAGKSGLSSLGVPGVPWHTQILADKLNLFSPEFGVSVDPTPTRGADYAHRITACPPRFENLAAALLFQPGGQILPT